MMVRMVSPFLKQKMRERIRIVNEGELEQYIDKDQLPDQLGGNLAYDHELFIKGEMSKATTAQAAAFTSSSKAAKDEEEDEEVPTQLPPGTVRLIDEHLARELVEERKRLLAEIDEKIRRHRESMARHTLPSDIAKILRSKMTRMSLDIHGLPSMEPNILHMRDTRVEGGGERDTHESPSPLAEQPGEEYVREQMEARMSKSIRRDRRVFFEKTGLEPGDTEDETSSEASFGLEKKPIST